MGEGAGAVGDGQCGGGGDGVGHVVYGDGGSLWAVGGICGYDLSDSGRGAVIPTFIVGIGGNQAGQETEDSNDGSESLHFDSSRFLI